MRCPICKAAGLSHIFGEKRVLRVDMSPVVDRYYDEDDKLHVHDSEVRTFVYSCSNGHHFRLDAVSRCTRPECDWNQKPEVLAGQKGLQPT